MKRFKSKFAAIERIRKQQEKLAAAQMATAERALRVAAMTVEVSRQKLNETVQQVEQLQQSACQWSGVQSGQLQVDLNQIAMQHKQSEYDLQKQETDAARQRRTVAFQKLKTIEEAASRERATYRKEQTAAQLSIQMENLRLDSGQTISPNQTDKTSREEQS